jgi:hypothetical protein
MVITSGLKVFGYGIPIILGYLSLSAISLYVGRVYSVLMTIVKHWGKRDPMTTGDYYVAWNCFKNHSHPLWMYDVYVFFFWPVFIPVALFCTIKGVIIAAWTRYVGDKRLNGQYSLIPVWLSKQSLINLVNRFI